MREKICFIVGEAIFKDLFWVYEELSYRQIIGVLHLTTWYRKLSSGHNEKSELLRKASQDFEQYKSAGYV